MNPLTQNVMLLLFLLATLTTFWRWLRRRRPLQVARFFIFAGGVAFYAWLGSPWYEAELSRWWVRALFVAWLLPEILENVDIILALRRGSRE